MLELKLLILIITANGAPIIASKLFSGLYSCPLDAGWSPVDNQPLFGKSKTVRGIVAALIATAAAGLIIGMPVLVCLLIAFFAMAGDLLSSFTKRRLGRPEGSMAPGLDQIPEALLPLLAVKSLLDLQPTDIVIVVTAFIVSELVLSFILYRLHIRKHPY